MWTSRPANVVGRVTSHLKHLKDQRAEVCQVLTLKGVCVCGLYSPAVHDEGRHPTGCSASFSYSC